MVTIALLAAPMLVTALVPVAPAYISRRSVFSAGALAVCFPSATLAAKDCFADCEANCNRVAPRSGRYCEQTCGDYCLQEDRQDGLSGSVGNANAEVGLLSAYDLKAKVTGGAPSGVVFGEDRPPALPDVFNVAPTLRSAITGGKSRGNPGSVEGQGGIQ